MGGDYVQRTVKCLGKVLGYVKPQSGAFGFLVFFAKRRAGLGDKAVRHAAAEIAYGVAHIYLPIEFWLSD